MRMARSHLRDQAGGDVVERERAPFFRHHRMKQDLEEKVADLLAQEVVVANPDGVIQLVSLFEQIGAQ
jgi:hypothetical protein